MTILLNLLLSIHFSNKLTEKSNVRWGQLVQFFY